MATSGESSSSGNIPQSTIAQFCAVTGSDEQVAIQMLDACGGNLDVAIGMHMDSVGDDSEASSAPPADLSGMRAPIPQKREVLVQDTFTFAPGLLNASALLGGTQVTGLRGRRQPARSVFDGFRDFQAEARQQQLEMSGVATGSPKRKTLEDLFRPPIDLMHKGSFHSARDAGTTHRKWLMVNIQNVQEFQCQTLNRDIWSNPTVKGLIKQHFIFWQVYHDSEEGRKYVQFYPVKEWPYIAILDPQTGENMAVLHKVDDNSFCELVNNFLSDHPSLDGSTSESPPLKKIKRNSSIVDASEDSQLEAAIAASLNETKTNKPETFFPSDSEEDEDAELETFSDSDTEASRSPAPTSTSKTTQPSTSTSSSTSASQLCNIAVTKTRTSDVSTWSNSGEAESQIKSLNTQNGKKSDLMDSKSSNTTKCDVPQSSNSQYDVHDGSLPGISVGSLLPLSSEQEGSESRSKNGESSQEKEESCSRQETSWQSYLGDDNDENSKLMIRFPDGKRQQLSIPCSSKLKALTLFVVEQGYPAEKFELVTTFPKRKISQLDSDQTLKQSGLFPQETIFVQER